MYAQIIQISEKHLVFLSTTPQNFRAKIWQCNRKILKIFFTVKELFRRFILSEIIQINNNLIIIIMFIIIIMLSTTLKYYEVKTK